MQPIISVVGKSDSGKTTMLAGLIGELKQRGYKMAVIKHSSEEFELDIASKDTWRFSQAGSEVSAISSGHKLAIFRKLPQDLTVKELARFMGQDYDLILTEGFKQSKNYKIEVHRKEQGAGLLSPQQQLLAVVTDEPLDVTVPQFTREEIPGLSDLIETWMLDQRRQDDVELIVNDTFVPVNPFTKNMLASTIAGMASALKGVQKVTSLQFSLRRKK
ncbi:molybdopterin-guanine dinucleotide biosynthesis protein B [Chloroflexota bacterium]